MERERKIESVTVIEGETGKSDRDSKTDEKTVGHRERERNSGIKKETEKDLDTERETGTDR